jgi:hypothetical protein
MSFNHTKWARQTKKLVQNLKISKRKMNMGTVNVPSMKYCHPKR